MAEYWKARNTVLNHLRSSRGHLDVLWKNYRRAGLDPQPDNAYVSVQLGIEATEGLQEMAHKLTLIRLLMEKREGCLEKSED